MFHKIPASKNSIAFRKLICGIGINNADYMVSPRINGKQITCPIYTRWTSMLKRVYKSKANGENPTYVGTEVCREWLMFGAFSDWFLDHNVDGYELDKDIKFKGNRIYSPEKCLFVPKSVNDLFLDSGAIRGGLPIGVVLNKRDETYTARVKSDGKQKHLGNFPTIEMASIAYKKGKNKEVLRKCEQYPEFAKYLKQHLYEV